MPNNIARIAGVMLASSLGVVACTDVTALKQENPGQLNAATLYVPKNAQILVNGVIADLECAFTRYVVGTAIFDDELANAISASNNFDYDRRTLQTNQGYGTATCGANQQPPIYTTLSIARADGDTVATHLEGWSDADVPNRMKLIGQSYAYAGYSLVLMGEAMCTAAINLGPELDSTAIFTEAKLRFDKAIAAATTANDATTLNLAYLGRARTFLDLHQPAQAGTDAARIPAGFVVNTSMDAVNTRRQNFAFLATGQSFWATIDPSYRGLTLGTGPDPRVAVSALVPARNGTAGVPIWIADKYNTFTAPMPIAKYAEAQLIVAEASAAAANYSAAETAINNARNTHNTASFTMPQYSVAGQTAAQVQAQIVEERRRELFLEGHRLGDLRRYQLAFTPASGTTYPSGGTYGTQTCFPLPDVERINNPNIGH